MRTIHTLTLTLLFLLASTGCTTSSSSYSSTEDQANPTYYIYLAGPEVFLPDPIDAGKKKKALINQLNEKHNWPFTLIGLYPMDNEIENFSANVKTGMEIYHANIDLMNKADFVTANMVRFRGPSMDVGTAFEMGYMRGLDKPVFAYYNAVPFYGAQETPGLYADRVAKYYPLSRSEPGKDIDGQSIEDFKMADNLMMVGALESGDGSIAPSFEAAVMQIAETLLKAKR